MIPVTIFADCDVAVVGAGLSGLATARALAAGGARVVVWDDKLKARDEAEAAGFAVRDLPAADFSRFAALVLLPGSDFEDGTLEVELAGAPRADAQPNMRGFVGLAFRVEELERTEYECFYLRPTNGRADDQLRRNHTTQYVSHPDFPWHRLRQEQPGVYESYADTEAGAWTKVKIVVEGERAQLFLHDAEQPALIVNDLKRGRSGGRVALWIGMGTEAHFRNLKLTRAE